MVEHNKQNSIPDKEDTYTLLSTLHTQDDCTQRELSLKLNVSLGKVNYLLKELVKRGLISVKNFSTNPQKIKKVRYCLTKKGFRARVELTGYFLQKKETEYLLMKKEWERLHNTEHRFEG